MLTRAQNAAAVAFVVAVMAFGQWLDMPSETQHAQDVAAEVAARESEAALMYAQHPSARQSARKRHGSAGNGEKT